MMAESLLKIADETGWFGSSTDLECKPALGAPGARDELAEKLARSVDISKCGLAAEGLVIVYEITG